MSSGPKLSFPTRPSMATEAPCLAAATDWLAPFPPGMIFKSSPVMVSPG